MQSVPVAEAAGEINFRTILLWHSQGRRKGDPKHKCCGKKNAKIEGRVFEISPKCWVCYLTISGHPEKTI